MAAVALWREIRAGRPVTDAGRPMRERIRLEAVERFGRGRRAGRSRSFAGERAVGGAVASGLA